MSKMKNIVFVCGTFNKDGGKASSIGQQLYLGFMSNMLNPNLRQYDCFFMNGGSLADLELAAHKAMSAHAVVWLANVPNEQPKNCVKAIKVVNQRCVLVTSKRSVEKQYSLPAVVQHALGLHANLVIMFEPFHDLGGSDKKHYRATLLDPLGNQYYQATHHAEYLALGAVLNLRVGYLLDLRRVGTTKAIGSCPEGQPDEPEFLDLVHRSAERFAQLIPSPEPVSRFVGNAAFRCTHGFPAVRSIASANTFYVSRRNVDKAIAKLSDFVPVIDETSEGNLLYCGDFKPSVDAPIQAKLFQLYPNIRYMLHGHVYLSLVPHTDTVLPCGALLEVDEVWRHYADHDCNAFALNLRGHGFLAGARTVARLEELVAPARMKARPMPEDQSEWSRRMLVTQPPVDTTED